MASPPHFQNPSDYFEESLLFFKNYEHLFNFSNTDILVNNALVKIEIPEMPNIDVYDENFDLFTIESKYLTDFLENCKQLRVDFGKFESEDLEFLVDVPLSEKKKHEIAYLAKAIDNLCKDIECDTVVDFGSGLGYLDQQLHETTTYNVLGLECNEINYVGAKKRQRKYHINSIESVKYIKHKITEDSHMNIEEYLNDKFPNYTNFCITGLHACADLTIDAVNLFLKMEKAKALIIMPCCYHRLQMEHEKFKNFPLSDKLRGVYERCGSDFLSVPFLRLAAQPPNVREEKLKNSVFNLMARAVLQLYGFKHNYKIKRNKRKAVRLKSIENNFEEYAQDALTGFTLIDETDNKINLDVEELKTIWRQISKMTFQRAAIFVLLQNYLQPVFENFVLYDRLVYLQEKGIEKCEFKRIVDEKISPRSLALLAIK